ncbi:MAG: excinuclease ABC subunit C, partial [bacterium]|nr:excinuclease ABC subunit C [bacterium]
PPLNLPLGNGEKKIVNWQQPDIIVIDGGWGQVNVAREVLNEYGLTIPIVGIAKGFDRKQDQPIFDKSNRELARTIKNHKDLLLQVRDEAHRFAVAYHKKLREKRALST